MRRIRISTWVLAAVFAAALVVYILVKPSSASIIGGHPHSAQHTRSTPAPAPALPLPGVGSASSPSPSPSASPASSASAS